MEVMTMHNTSNMHAMRVPSQPCDANVLHMHKCPCMQIPIPCQAISISLSRSKRCQGGGWNNSTPPRSQGSPKRATQRVAPREEKRRWVLVRLRLMGKREGPARLELEKARLGTPAWNLAFMVRWYQVSKVFGENQAISAIKHAGMGWPSPCQRTQWTH